MQCFFLSQFLSYVNVFSLFTMAVDELWPRHKTLLLEDVMMLAAAVAEEVEEEEVQIVAEAAKSSWEECKEWE